MLETLQQIAASDEAFMKSAETSNAELLATIGPTMSPIQKFRTLRTHGNAVLMVGENELAVESLTRAFDLLPQLQGKVTKADFVSISLELSVAYLRVAEMENCVACCNGESCLFPITSAARHQSERGSRGAIKCLTGLLSQIPNELRARWLLNLAYMTLGEYPDNVPSHLLVPLRPTDEIDFHRFENVAANFKLNEFNLSGGVICDDFDDDGDFDVVTSSWSTRGQLLYYRNEGNGTFSNQTEFAGLQGVFGGLNLVQADYDNDNDLDILVLRGAWLGEEGCQPRFWILRRSFTDTNWEPPVLRHLTSCQTLNRINLSSGCPVF